MQEIKEQPTTASEATDGLMADALRAEAWAGEPFIREGEDPAKVLAPGTSRRRALDDALAEIEGGQRTPSSGWKVEYGLMLGLERVLAEEKPHLASGTELRRHQIDALAGMLTELIASHEKEAGPNGNGNSVNEVAEAEAEAEDEDEPAEESAEDVLDEDVEEDEHYTGPDPGAARRYRFRHPTASGKSSAAGGAGGARRDLAC
jgi:ribonuclease E